MSSNQPLSWDQAWTIIRRLQAEETSLHNARIRFIEITKTIRYSHPEQIDVWINDHEVRRCLVDHGYMSWKDRPTVPTDVTCPKKNDMYTVPASFSTDSTPTCTVCGECYDSVYLNDQQQQVSLKKTSDGMWKVVVV